MATARVRLPLSATPCMPECCCMCMRREPHSHLAVEVYDVHLLRPSSWLSAETFTLPACRTCQRSRITRWVLRGAALVLLVAGEAFWLGGNLYAGVEWIVAGALGITFAALTWWWWRRWPIGFRARLDGEHVVIDFVEPEFARVLVLHNAEARLDEQR